MSHMETLNNCPACGACRFKAERTPRLKIGTESFGEDVGSYALTRCRECGLVFVNPRPSPEALGAFYNTPGYGLHEFRAVSPVIRRLFEFRMRFLGATARGKELIDVGSGGGMFIAHACDNGWHAVGMEPSIVGRTSAQRQGLEVFETIEQVVAAGRRFDAITMFHVFEHVPDMGAFLGLVEKCLMPEGVLVVEVPNWSSLRARITPWLSGFLPCDERYRAFPIHLYGFGKGSLLRTFERSGWEVLKTTTVGIGLDELRTTGNVQPNAVADTARDAHAVDVVTSADIHRTRYIRTAIKNAIYGLGLGENLLASFRKSHGG